MDNNDNGNVGIRLSFAVADLKKGFKEATASTKDYRKTLKGLEKDIKSAFNSAPIIGMGLAIKEITKSMINATKKQSEYIENLHLLQNAYGTVNSSGEKLINTMSDLSGFDPAQLTKSLGRFRQLSSALGITNQEANLLSENLLKISNDIASLYNMENAEVASKLMSALTGETEAMKILGADITTTALQQKAYSLGIKESVTNMSQAEKTILRYLSVQDQLKNVQGDYAKTINNVSNQIKILNSQISMLGRQLGATLIPVLKAVLPYLNGIIMAVNEILKIFLEVIGVNSGITSVSDSFIDLKDSISGVSKELNKSLRGFDKLNVIKTPSASSGISLGDGSINKTLLAQLTEYDDKLSSVRSKARDIRDNILKTLNFHKELNEETGEWEWKYDGFWGTIKNLWREFKKLNPLAKVFVGYMTFFIATSTLKNLGKLVGLFGNKTGLGKFIGNLLTPTQVLFSSLKDGIKYMIKNKSAFNISKEINSWSAALTPIEKFKTALVGVGGIVVGLKAVKDGIKDIATEGANTSNILQTSLGGLSTIIGGGLAGASVGGVTGGIIGMVVSGALLITQALDEIDTATNTNIHRVEELSREVSKAYEEWQNDIKNLQEVYSQSTAEEDYYKRLWNELKNITEENGKIKQGYEDRAKTITTILSNALGIEINIIDGQIQQYKDLQTEIQNTIDKKYAMVKLSALEEAAQKAIKNEKIQREKIPGLYQEQQTALEKLTEALGKHKNMSDEMVAAAIKSIETGEDVKDLNVDQVDLIYKVIAENSKLVTNYKKVSKTYKDNTKLLNDYNSTIHQWETATELATKGNYEQLNWYFDHEQALYGKSIVEQQKYWEEYVTGADIQLATLEKTKENYSKRDYEALKKQYQDEKDLASRELDNLNLLYKTKLGDISDTSIEAWANMAKTSERDFIFYMSQLPEDIQKEVIDKMKAKGYKISDELQAGINEKTPKVEINVSVNDTKYKQWLKDNNLSDTWQSKAAYGVTGGATKKIGTYYQGGFPTKGDLFIANERTPEYVGSIGGQPAVANNDQIVDGISSGFAKAIMATGRNVNINITAEGDTEGLLNFINFKQKQKDRQYGF